MSLARHVRYMPARCAPGKPLQHTFWSNSAVSVSTGIRQVDWTRIWMDGRCDLPQRHGTTNDACDHSSLDNVRDTWTMGFACSVYYICLRQLASARKQSIPFELSCCSIPGDVAAVSSVRCLVARARLLTRFITGPRFFTGQQDGKPSYWLCVAQSIVPKYAINS